MSITNITGYKFTNLSALDALRHDMLMHCANLHLKGTILLSEEGINLSLAGDSQAIAKFKMYLQQDQRFADMTFRESVSLQQSFKRLKIKLKKEIITFRQNNLHLNPHLRAPSISPHELKHWLDEGRQFTLLDTRNDYEVRFGTFHGAMQLNLNHFSEFPAAIDMIPQDKPVVMFCTGGIRCEKAALHLMNQGHEHVYQLDGGILNYFIEVGPAYFAGECYVFDERIALDGSLHSQGTLQCLQCQGPIRQNEQQHTSHKLCLHCEQMAPLADLSKV